jgi:peptide/nickel transport system permease protein
VWLIGLRLVRLVAVSLVVSFFSFIILDASPTDIAEVKAGFNATPEVVAQIRADLGLDDPLLVRYVRWLGDVATGDFGESTVNGVSAWSQVREALPKTLEIMVLAQLMALAIAIPSAIHSARNPGGLVDRISSASAFGFLALPAYVLGLYLAWLLGVRLGWLPAVATDIPGLNDNPLENLRQLFLPSLTIALNLVAAYLRLLRTDLIDTLQQDYVLLAKARGYTDRRVLWRHALRPSSLSLLTAVGLNTAGLIGGALVVELLFAVPGMGQLTVRSIFSEDFVVVQAAVLLICLAFVTINFVVDVAYALVDPRIRSAGR